MLTLITSLLGDFLPIIAGAVALLGAWVGHGAINRRKGRKLAENEAKEADYENAQDIRARVDRDLPDELRKHDGDGWRD